MRESRREARDEFKGRRGCTVNGMIFSSVDPPCHAVFTHRYVASEMPAREHASETRKSPAPTSRAAAVYKYFANFRSRRGARHATLLSRSRGPSTPPTRTRTVAESVGTRFRYHRRGEILALKGGKTMPRRMTLKSCSRARFRSVESLLTRSDVTTRWYSYLPRV